LYDDAIIMLRELSVQNLALIEDVRVDLQPGFCAWTGETGAGKTLLLEAVGLLLGERGSVELLRTGSEELRITGRFEVPDPELRSQVEGILNTTLEDDQVILSRRLLRSGRGYAYANDRPVALATLKQMAGVLVDVHGQRESQSLLQPAYQLQLLDAFGNLGQLRQKYVETADRVRQLRQQHAALVSQQQQRQRDLALLRFEREELDAVNPRPGELAELTRQRDQLAHAEALQLFAGTARARLDGEDGSVTQSLGKTLKEAQGWAAIDPGLGEVVRSLEALIAQAHDLTDLLRTVSERWEADPARLEQVQDRIQQLRRLETKYGSSIDALIAYRSTLDEQERRLTQQESDLGQTLRELTEAFSQLRQAGEQLSQKRRQTAGKLVKEVKRHLADLGMAGAQLDARLEPVPLGEDTTTVEVPSWGLDSLELMLAANPGEPARPLRKVASGGELSRTMLALKTVLADHDRVSTLIFDEIDANVGGRLGDVLGEKLAALARTHQVICVTHLPQVASYARHQWTIRKKRHGNRTTTTIELLGDAERLEELASMLRGEARSETTRQEAAAMLAAARRRW